MTALSSSAFAAEDATEQPLVRPAGEQSLDAFKWITRPVVIFADSPADPRFIEQMQHIERGLEELRDRDVVVLVDTTPDVLSPLREELRPRGFVLVLIGKDGGVKLRKPSPWTVRELSRTIDKMPMRQQEIRDARASD